MAITVDWSAKPWLITIPQSDCTLVSGTEYQITVDTLWQLLRDFSDGPEGSAQKITFRRTAATASTPSITEINDPFYEAEFEDGLWSVDIINGNTNFRDVEVKNQVSVGTNNTTGFIDPTFLEFGLFNSVVAIHPTDGVAGTGKTAAGEVIGTRRFPSNNIADAKTIADTNGLHIFNLMDDITVSGVDLSVGYEFIGDSPFIILTIDASADVTNCSARQLSITGEMDGFNTVRDASLGAITDISGFIEKVSFQSTASLSGNTALFETYSQVTGVGYPTITTGTNNLIVRDHHGSLGIAGMTSGTSSIGVYGGRLIIEASCTGGTIYVRGDPYEIIDGSAGTNVIDQSSCHKITRTFKRLGLDPSNPVTDDTGTITTPDSDVDIVRTGDGLTTSTLTQQ